MKHLLKEVPEPIGFVKSITETKPDDQVIERKTTYASLIDKKPLRQFLIQEQSGLCCYCQSTIELTNSLTEHYLPQSKHKQESLVYSNLYASCECNDLRREQNETSKGEFCGHAKGQNELNWSPIKDTSAIASASKPNPFFTVNSETGDVTGNSAQKGLADGFIRICNLNHTHLKRARATTFITLTELNIPLPELKARVASNPSFPYNQFILNALHP